MNSYLMCVQNGACAKENAWWQKSCWHVAVLVQFKMPMPKLWLPRQVSINCGLINRRNTKNGFYSHVLFQLFSSRILDVPSPLLEFWIESALSALLNFCFSEHSEMDLTPCRDQCHCHCSDIHASMYKCREVFPVCGRMKLFHEMHLYTYKRLLVQSCDADACPSRTVRASNHMQRS